MTKLPICLLVASASLCSAPARALGAADDFGLRVLNRLSAGSPSNLAVSPWGLGQSLAIVREGARGTTRAEVERFAPQPLPENSGLKFALRLWLQQDYTVQKKFQDGMKKNFADAFAPMDLLGDTAVAVKAINAWTSAQTDKRVASVMREEDMEEMLLTGAFAWRGSWGVAVDRKATKPGEFTTLKGAKGKASYMRLTGAFRAVELEDAQAIELPLAGEGASMLVVLPKDPKGLVKVEKSMTAARMDEIEGKLASVELEVLLPRFRVNFGQDYIPLLKAAGVSAAFAKGADFSGITGTKELFLHRLQHRVAVEVDESSRAPAEATPAATPAPAPAAEVRTVKVGHPFFFAVRQGGVGLISGRVTSP